MTTFYGKFLIARGEENYYLYDGAHHSEGLPPDHPNQGHFIGLSRDDGKMIRFAISDVVEGSDTWLPPEVKDVCVSLMVEAGYTQTIAGLKPEHPGSAKR